MLGCNLGFHSHDASKLFRKKVLPRQRQGWYGGGNPLHTYMPLARELPAQPLLARPRQAEMMEPPPGKDRTSDQALLVFCSRSLLLQNALRKSPAHPNLSERQGFAAGPYPSTRPRPAAHTSDHRTVYMSGPCFAHDASFLNAHPLH